MLTIPAIPRKFGPWSFKCTGIGSKTTKLLIEEVIKTTLVYEKIKKKEILIEIYLNTPDYMAKTNKKYRNKEEPTDTISIPFNNETIYEEGPTFLGIIFLCPEIIKKKAQELEVDETKHLAHITVHSVLHLLGYDHEEDEEAKKMEAKEAIILGKLGIPSPYLKKLHLEKANI